MSSFERTGFRDETMSRRHRLYGRDVPCTDIDMIHTEYDNAVPKALIEYKGEHAGPVLPTDPNIRCITNLANMAGLPVFGVRYAQNLSWLRVAPLNDAAKAFVPEVSLITEPQYVELLYKLRGRKMPEGITEKLLPVAAPVLAAKDQEPPRAVEPVLAAPEPIPRLYND